MALGARAALMKRPILWEQHLSISGPTLWSEDTGRLGKSWVHLQVSPSVSILLCILHITFSSWIFHIVNAETDVFFRPHCVNKTRISPHARLGTAWNSPRHSNSTHPTPPLHFRNERTLHPWIPPYPPRSHSRRRGGYQGRMNGSCPIGIRRLLPYLWIQARLYQRRR